MGLFDTVTYRCPHCGARTEEQTKAGECILGEYNAEAGGTNIPGPLLTTLVEQQKKEPIYCAGCQNKFRLKLLTIPCGILEAVPEDE